MRFCLLANGLRKAKKEVALEVARRNSKNIELEPSNEMEVTGLLHHGRKQNFFCKVHYDVHCITGRISVRILLMLLVETVLCGGFLSVPLVAIPGGTESAFAAQGCSTPLVACDSFIAARSEP